MSESEHIYIRIETKDCGRNNISVIAMMSNEKDGLAEKVKVIIEEGKRVFKSPETLHPLYKISEFIESEKDPNIFVPLRKN